MSGNAIVLGGIDSNRKLQNFTMGFTCFVYLLVAPTIEIGKGLLDGEKLLSILSENEEITASLSFVLLAIVVWVIVVIGERISKLNHE